MRRKQVTQLDIAREANVSRELVSVVLNGKDPSNKRCRKDVQERIEKIARKYNYRTNRSALLMKEKRHGSIGILVKHFELIPSGLFSEMLLAAKEQDYTLILEQLPENLDDKITMLDDYVADGLMVFSDMPEKIQKRLDMVRESVLYFNTNKRSGFDVITIADEEGGYAAGKLLADAGRKKLAYISWKDQQHPHYSVEARRQGVLRCCRDRGINLVLDYNIDYFTLINHYEEASEIVYEVLLEHDIDGVVLHSDLVAPTVYNAAYRLGKNIPDDYSVVSFNNSNASYFLIPKLASFGVEYKTAAKLIVDRMIDLIDGKKNLETIRLPLNLFEGKSI